jgi:hypothetical protein
MAAADLGVSYRDVTDRLWRLRTRLGVSDNRGAIAWLDDHEPGWRDEDTSNHDESSARWPLADDLAGD